MDLDWKCVYAGLQAGVEDQVDGDEDDEGDGEGVGEEEPLSAPHCPIAMHCHGHTDPRSRHT